MDVCRHLSFLGTLTVLTSCKDNDEILSNVIKPEQIVGKWYAENNTPGTYEAGGLNIEYEKIVQPSVGVGVNV